MSAETAITIEELLIVALQSDEALFHKEDLNLPGLFSEQLVSEWKFACNIFKVIFSLTESEELLASFAD
jgi:hypothetical protein